MERKMKLWVFLICVVIAWSASANATGGDRDCPPGHHNISSCDDDDDGGEAGPPGPQGPPGPAGPRGPRGHDGKDGKDGKDGRDGIDGKDGKDGRDGIDGKDGKDGRDGIDGKDGVVDYREVDRIIDRTYSDYWAAISAIQIHLPQDHDSRFTLSGSRVNGSTGLGAGYAYMFDRDDNLAISGGVGTSGGETVGILSVGFEFGADRGDVNYNPELLRLERRLNEMQRQLDEQAVDCSETASRVHRICQAK